MYAFCRKEKFLKHRLTAWIKTRHALTWVAKQFAGEEPDARDPYTLTRAEQRTARRRKKQAQSHPQHTRHSNPQRKARRKKNRQAQRKKKHEEKRKKREERGETLVGIGDWALKGNTNSIIRGHQLAPNQGLRKALLQRPGVVVLDINEAYTSKRCYRCQSVDAEMQQAPAPGTADPCYQYLRCVKCQTTVQRDENASLNILRLTRYKLESQDRPAYLCPKPHEQGTLIPTRKLDQRG